VVDTYTDDFNDSTIAGWVKTGTLLADVVGRDYITASTGAPFAVVAADGVTISTIVESPSTTYTVTCSGAHGVPSTVTTFRVRIIGNDTAAFNAEHVATYVSSTAFTITLTTGLTPSTLGSAYIGKTTSDANHVIDALVACSAEGSSKSVLLWSRIDPLNTVAGLLPDYGYALSLNWGDSDVRTLSFIKVLRGGSGTLETLTDTTVALRAEIPYGATESTDLNVYQHIRFMVLDAESQDNLPQKNGVILRAYIDTGAGIDDGNPTLEYTDYADLGATGNLQPDREAGGWGFAFGSTGLFMDAFSASDTYVIPEHGVLGKKGRTLSEMRTLVVQRMTIGGATSHYQDALLNEAINNAVNEVRSELGDAAGFFTRLGAITVTADANNIVTLPEDCDRLMDIWDYSSHEHVNWNAVGEDSRGRVRIEIAGTPVADTFIIEYVQSYEPMEADTDRCPILKEHDEAVIVGACVRLWEMEGKSEMFAMWSERWKKAIRDLKRLMSRRQQQRHPAMRIHVRRPRTRIFPVQGYSEIWPW